MVGNIENEIVENGKISVDSVFRFAEKPSELSEFLQLCKNKKCVVEFELEDLICEADGYLRKKQEEKDEFSSSLFLVSLVAYMSMFKEYSEKHWEYLTNLSNQKDGWVKRIYSPELVDVFTLPEQSDNEVFDIKSGVYFIFTNDFKELLYIGKSKRRVWRRILRHRDMLDYLATYTGDYKYENAGIKVIPFDVENVDLMEKLYIKKYKPPMNTQYCDRKNGGKYTNYYDFVFSKIDSTEENFAQFV